MIILFLAGRSGRTLGSLRKGKTVLVLLLLIAACGIFGKIILGVGQGAGKEYLLTRMFKYNEPAYERDVSGRRFGMWKHCLGQWASHPAIGVGLGARLTYDTGKKIIAVPIHNLYVQTLAQTGTVGFAIVMVAGGAWLLRATRTLKRETSPTRFWPRLAMVSYACLILWASLYGDVLPARCVGFTFWLLVGLETTAHSQLLHLWSNSRYVTASSPVTAACPHASTGSCE